MHFMQTTLAAASVYNVRHLPPETPTSLAPSSSAYSRWAPGSTSIQSIGHSVDLFSSSQRAFCTQCYRPWQYSRYKTCDGCRQSCRQEYRGRLLPTTTTETFSPGPSDTARDGFPGPVSSDANGTRRFSLLPQPRANRQRIIDPQAPTQLEPITPSQSPRSKMVSGG